MLDYNIIKILVNLYLEKYFLKKLIYKSPIKSMFFYFLKFIKFILYNFKIAIVALTKTLIHFLSPSKNMLILLT